MLSFSKHQYVKMAAQLNSVVSVTEDPFPTIGCLLFMTFRCEFERKIPSLSHNYQCV